MIQHFFIRVNDQRNKIVKYSLQATSEKITYQAIGLSVRFPSFPVKYNDAYITQKIFNSNIEFALLIVKSVDEQAHIEFWMLTTLLPLLSNHIHLSTNS